MRSAEWSLIFFTVFSQTAIGVFIIISCFYNFYVFKGVDVFSREQVLKILLLILGLSFIAMLSSIFHLGKIKNAIYALNHFSSSWLSREIFFLVAFVITTIILALLQFRQVGSTTTSGYVLIFGSILGILAVYSMAKVYMLSTVPVWNTLLTPLHFFMSTLTLGGICILFLFSLTDITLYFNTNTTIYKVTCMLYLIVIASLLLNLSGHIVNLLSLPNLGLSGVESYKIITEKFALLLYARIILSIIALLLLLYLFINIEKNHYYSIIPLITLLIFISEIIGRFLFYSSYSRVGI